MIESKKNEISRNIPTKKVKGLFGNCKTLMKKIKDDNNNWEDISCSWTRGINIVKMLVLPQKQYTDLMQSLQNTYDIFKRLEKII